MKVGFYRVRSLLCNFTSLQLTDDLVDKRIWLRPGQKYIFGRTKFRKGRDGE